MKWVQVVPAKKSVAKDGGPAVVTVRALGRGDGMAALVSKTGQQRIGWEAGLTFDLWVHMEGGSVGITCYKADGKQGAYVCSARGAKELTEAVRQIGGKPDDVFAIQANEDAHCDVVQFVIRRAAP